jgi:hypothetical protein
MGLLSYFFGSKKPTNSSIKKTNEYVNYRDKFQNIWNLSGEYTEKINTYYSDFINYKKQEDFNNLLLVCEKYIEILPLLQEAQKEDSRINKTVYPKKMYSLPHHKLAMAYEKAECYNSAIKVCQEAISKGYTDNTKGDFKGRIEKLKKKLNK